MEPEAGAIDATGEAVRSLFRLLDFGSIGRRVAIRLLLLLVCGHNVLAVVIVDITSKFEVKISFDCRSSGGSTVSGRQMLASGNRGVGPGLEGLQSSWSVGNNSEVTSKWRSNIGGSGLRVDLEQSVAVIGASSI